MAAPRLPARGLRNLGNTCFLNCVLQSLQGVRSLRKFLHAQAALGNKQPLTVALHHSLVELGNKSLKTPADPRAVTRVPILQTSFRYRKQQDAHELLQKLLTGLDEEAKLSLQTDAARRLPLKTLQGSLSMKEGLSAASGSPSATTRSSSQSSSFSVSSKSFHQLAGASSKYAISSAVPISSHLNQDISSAAKDFSAFDPLPSPFSGILGSELKCTFCAQWGSRKKHEFVNLSLTIPKDKLSIHASSPKICDLMDCLDEYTRIEKVHGVECPACTYIASSQSLRERLCVSPFPDTTFIGDPLIRRTPTASMRTMLRGKPLLQVRQRTMDKYLYIARPPVALCFHVNRLTATKQKVHTFVRFPLELDLSAYCRSDADLPAPSTCLRNCSPPRVAATSNIHRRSASCRGGAGASSPPPLSLSSSPPKSYLMDRAMREMEMKRRGGDGGDGEKVLSGVSVSRWQDGGVVEGGEDVKRGESGMKKGGRGGTGSSRRYQLVSVIVHHGSGENGHFETYRRTESDEGHLLSQWVHISDESVRQATEDEVLHASAYMLFYELDNVLPLPATIF